MHCAEQVTQGVLELWYEDVKGGNVIPPEIVFEPALQKCQVWRFGDTPPPKVVQQRASI